ncbi:ER membrane protein complex subunit 2 [Tachysurus ichikawai]
MQSYIHHFTIWMFTHTFPSVLIKADKRKTLGRAIFLLSASLNPPLLQQPLGYSSIQHYAKAAFCLEELMMTNPHNHLYCEQYAEVKYTQGGAENLELARKYFAQALKLNNRNMRALFGLYMSASHIAGSPKVSAKVKKDNVKYAAWAASQINRAYQLAGRGKKENKCSMKAVEEMLESMQITMS